MKSIVWETAPKIALRNYSKDGQYRCDFVEGVYIFFAHLFFVQKLSTHFLKVSAAYKEQLSPWILVFF